MRSTTPAPKPKKVKNIIKKEEQKPLKLNIEIKTEKCIGPSGEKSYKILSVDGPLRKDIPTEFFNKGQNEVCYLDNDEKLLSIGGNIIIVDRMYSEIYFQETIVKAKPILERLQKIVKDREELAKSWHGKENFKI